MSTFLFYLTIPIIYMVSYCPSWILYRLSDVLFFVVYYLFGYRRKVVETNLRNAFPDKNEKERSKIEKKYYQYLCDLILESIKTITMSESYVHRHVKFHNIDKMNSLFNKNESILIVMGHFGNWELAGPCFSLSCKHQLNVIYKPLTNPNFENLFSKARTKFSTKIIPMESTLRSLVKNKKEVDATVFIADQTPSDIKSGMWMNFLNQDTLVFTGPEKLSKMFDYPIVYMHVDRVKRGKYEITPTILFDEPNLTSEKDITQAFFKKLEEDIIKKPEIWLWSHRRWKRTRKTD